MQLFTIYICTYNGSKTIKSVLEAILKLQGLTENVKSVVVVDNNSTDNTKIIIEQYIERNGIFLYEFENRQGLSFARQHATNAATEWVIFLDDDNILDEFWLKNLLKSVGNKDIGIINGSVIPKTDGLSKEEIERLKIIYKDLACSHMYEQDINKNDDIIHPYGAGLVVSAKSLKTINDEGWLDLVGRNGEKLSSGEDGELVLKILQQGYKFLYNPNMLIYHIIPKERLSLDYIKRLYEGLTQGCYQLYSKNKHYIINRLLKLIKSFLKLILAAIFRRKNPINFLRRKIIFKTYLGEIKRDKLFWRKK